MVGIVVPTFTESVKVGQPAGQGFTDSGGDLWRERCEGEVALRHLRLGTRHNVNRSALESP